MHDNSKNVLLLFFAVIFLIAAESRCEKKEVYQAIVDETGTQKVKMTAGNYFYRPDYIEVRMNAPVEITIRREGVLPHSFVLQSPEAGINLEEELTSEPKTIRFTPRTEGEFAFYCDGGLIESHREKGMEGILHVTRAGDSQF